MVQTVLSTRFVEFTEEIDSTYRTILAKSPRSLGIPFLETLMPEVASISAEDLLLRNRKLDEMIDVVNLLHSESRAFAVNTDGTALVSVVREVLQMIKVAFNLVVFGVDQSKENIQTPKLIHWGDVDISLLHIVQRKLLGLWELFSDSEKDQPSALLTETVLYKCINTPLETSADTTQRNQDGDEELLEASSDETELRKKNETLDKMDAEIATDIAKPKSTRLSSGILKKRFEDDYSESNSKLPSAQINSNALKRKGLDSGLEKSRSNRESNKKDEVDEYLKNVRKYKKSVILSPPFLSLLEFWIQLLIAFESRVTACNEWKTNVQNALKTINNKSSQALGEVLQQLVKEAMKNGFRCNER